MVGLSISRNVIPIPFAIAEAPCSASVIFEGISAVRLAKVPTWDLVLRSSTRLEIRDAFVPMKRRDVHPLPDFFQIALRETRERFRDRAVRFGHEKSWHGANPKRIAYRITFPRGIDQDWKCNAETLVKNLRGFRVVLRDPDHLNRFMARQAL